MAQKSYRDWILTPVPVLVDRPGFAHYEMAAQACISIQSTHPVRPLVVQDGSLYRIALEAPSEHQLRCAEIILENLLPVDQGIDRS